MCENYQHPGVTIPPKRPVPKKVPERVVEFKCDFCGARPGAWCKDFRGNAARRLHSARWYAFAAHYLS